MNIQNFTPFNPSWEEVFKKQRELKFMYEPDAKELFENFDIDCYEDQEAFKRYCWRITEELTEAMEALVEGSREHAKEEIVDAFNFSIELMLLYGWSEKDLLHICSCERFGDGFKTAIYHLGLSANCLKNRQWRRSQYMVDLIVFENRFKCFISSMLSLCEAFFDTTDALKKAWSLKYQVNLFRIQTNY